MARNDQLVRQWHLIQRLESSQGATLRELADSLPDGIPKHLRTLRRDLAAIESAGYPVVTDRTRAGTRWKLMEGFRRIPALTFSGTELMALLFSRDLLKPLAGTYVYASLDSALTKAAAALPPAGLAYVRQMQEFFSVRLGPHKTYRQHRDTIDRLTRAIAEHRSVQMRYFSASRGATTRREIDPYHLWYAAGALYLIGYDHRHREIRTFAVERIRSLTATDRPYQLPLAFDVEDYVQDALVVMRGTPIAVELVFDKATAAWVRDRLWHPSQQLTPLGSGRLRMTLRVAETRELVGWILSFGGGVRVVRPDALRDEIRRAARQILRGK
ncbi:MAG: helix-turn-helix transcriptional regulator [Candidatus Rokuibacteriota bacterium]